jgi:hypothetical protein
MAQHMHSRAAVASMVTQEDLPMLAFLAIILLFVWVLGVTVFPVTGGLIHLLILFAVISLVMHFVRGSSVV